MTSRGSVLVTRPQGRASDSLCALVEEAGYSAHSQPLLALEPLSPLPAAQRAMLLDLDRYASVIFISANAVRFGMGAIGDFWPQLPAGIAWFAIGSATAALLGDYGVDALTPGRDMSSEGLLALPALREPAGQRVLIVKGEGGRDTLARELGARGALVDELACYRRRLPVLADGELAAKLRRWHIDTVLISSGEGLANLLELLSPAESTNFSELRLVVPSKRVADVAHAGGFNRVMIAENASDAAMLRALRDQGQAGE